MDVHEENSTERIEKCGLGCELLRRVYVTQLRTYMEAFYEHGSLPDIIALSRALEVSEQASAGIRPPHAPLLESLLELLGVGPESLFADDPQIHQPQTTP